jgi:pimeloyl-ACP methyl ester carboxylesterase
MIGKPTYRPAGPSTAHYGDGMLSPTTTERVMTAPGVEVVVTSHGGANAGVPVLLLHGLSQQRVFWDPVVHRLRSRPVAAMDQRGHGETDTALDQGFSVPACAADVVAVLDSLGWGRAIVVGHSWGASVALETAASAHDRVAAAVLVDGGLWSPASLGPREAVREALTPPALGIPAADLWDRIRGGDLGPWWSDEVQAALAPTFRADAQGLVRTRLGMDRHLKVLDGMLDHDLHSALDRCTDAGVPVWAAVCEPAGMPVERTAMATAWQRAKDDAVADARLRGNCLVQTWSGAVHDVPLQWPALVAGLVDTVVEQAEGGDR